VIHICRTPIAVLLAASIGIPSASIAAENEVQAPQASRPRLTYNGRPLASMPLVDQSGTVERGAVATVADQFGYGRRRRGNDSAMAAMLLGAAGAIAGTAVLVYANRPECSANPNLGGCGYGTKVVGGAVLSAGLVGLLIGAVTWR